MAYVALAEDVTPLALRPPIGSKSTRSIVIRGDMVICDLGRLIKTVRLPFPTARRLKAA